MSMSKLGGLRIPAALLLSIALLTPAILLSQGLTGRVSGTISDASGAVVTNAEITVTNVQPRQTRSAKTDDAGYFSFNELLPGSYNVSVTAPGFKRYEQQSVSVTANERVTLPQISLEVG